MLGSWGAPRGGISASLQQALRVFRGGFPFGGREDKGQVRAL